MSAFTQSASGNIRNANDTASQETGPASRDHVDGTAGETLHEPQESLAHHAGHAESVNDTDESPAVDPAHAFYIGDDPTPRTYEEILEHRRATALERCELAGRIAAIYTTLAADMVAQATENGTELDFWEHYNMLLIARRWARIARPGDRIREIRARREAESAGVTSSLTNEETEAAPPSDTKTADNP